MIVFLGRYPDPGPCPVDDAPHTTCTSADYAGTPLTVPVRRPRSLPPPVPVVELPVLPVSFTSATYRGLRKPKPKVKKKDDARTDHR